jgi:cysteinyl-tRNA synthetase
MHVKHLLIDEETMSKSKGNFFTIPDILERGHSPEAIRYLLAGSHYRNPLNFGFEGLQQAAAALERIHGLVERLGEAEGEGSEGSAAEACQTASKTFTQSLADDLNTPEALAAVHGLVGDANSLLAEGKLGGMGAAAVRTALEAMDSVFGVLLPTEAADSLSPEEQALFDGRQDARRQREFARADDARARLEAMGIVLEDTPRGTRWRRKR